LTERKKNKLSSLSPGLLWFGNREKENDTTTFFFSLLFISENSSISLSKFSLLLSSNYGLQQQRNLLLSLDLVSTKQRKNLFLSLGSATNKKRKTKQNNSLFLSLSTDHLSLPTMML
jgi:hypothetical protein